MYMYMYILNSYNVLMYTNIIYLFIFICIYTLLKLIIYILSKKNSHNVAF